ncbi:hypothetical protein LEN26_019697 [Aphanomyces euteiches]|nr:hypothetical protein LEN26_019697 [Aphanomyces euteiches]KAH9110041.1 hypothetical protein AeMF1_015045 [Aphanomyces euteiches]KAH9187587.1 hypothetical protein AeNC1_010432 [Aphanomyces euteiches]
MGLVALLLTLASLATTATPGVHSSLVYDASTTWLARSTVYNESHALYLGRLVAVSYCSKEHIDKWTCPPCKYIAKLRDAIVINDEAQDFQGMVGFTGTHIVVAFRGSLDLKNWIADFTLLKTHPWPKTLPTVQVHRGFYWTYQGIRDKLVLALAALQKQHPNAPLIITGHSLGAAVTAIAVVDLHVRYNVTTQQMITFGQPRTGNTAFVAQLLQIVPHVFRVTHWRDIVPHIPTVWQGYEHAPQEIWYTEDAAKYKACDPLHGEDPACSMQFPWISSLGDHIFYLNITMGHINC